MDGMDVLDDRDIFPVNGSLDKMREWWTGHEASFRDDMGEDLRLSYAARTTAGRVQDMTGMDGRDASLFTGALLTEHVDEAFEFLDHGDREKLQNALLGDISEGLPEEYIRDFVSAGVNREGTPGAEVLLDELSGFVEEGYPPFFSGGRIGYAYTEMGMELAALDIAEELDVPFYDTNQVIYDAFNRTMPHAMEELEDKVLDPLKESVEPYGLHPGLGNVSLSDGSIVYVDGNRKDGCRIDGMRCASGSPLDTMRLFWDEKAKGTGTYESRDKSNFAEHIGMLATGHEPGSSDVSLVKCALVTGADDLAWKFAEDKNVDRLRFDLRKHMKSCLEGKPYDRFATGVLGEEFVDGCWEGTPRVSLDALRSCLSEYGSIRGMEWNGDIRQSSDLSERERLVGCVDCVEEHLAAGIAKCTDIMSSEDDPAYGYDESLAELRELRLGYAPMGNDICSRLQEPLMRRFEDVEAMEEGHAESDAPVVRESDEIRRHHEDKVDMPRRELDFKEPLRPSDKLMMEADGMDGGDIDLGDPWTFE